MNQVTLELTHEEVATLHFALSEAIAQYQRFEAQAAPDRANEAQGEDYERKYWAETAERARRMMRKLEGANGLAIVAQAKLVETAKPQAKPVPVKLTQRLVKDYLRLLGGTLKRTDYGDLRLRFANADPDKDEVYFTDSLEDVIFTARVMKGGHANAEQADEFLFNLGWFEIASTETKR